MDKSLTTEVAKIPTIYNWVRQKEQRGCRPSGIGIIIGELGNLDNYPTVSTVWKRMGCTPIESGGLVVWCKLVVRGRENTMAP